MTASVVAMHDDSVTIPSDLLGPLTLPSNEIVRFPGGLYGFPACRTGSAAALRGHGILLQLREHANVLRSTAVVLLASAEQFTVHALALSEVRRQAFALEEVDDDTGLCA